METRYIEVGTRGAFSVFKIASSKLLTLCVSRYVFGGTWRVRALLYVGTQIGLGGRWVALLYMNQIGFVGFRWVA